MTTVTVTDIDLCHHVCWHCGKCADCCDRPRCHPSCHDADTVLSVLHGSSDE